MPVTWSAAAAAAWRAHSWCEEMLAQQLQLRRAGHSELADQLLSIYRQLAALTSRLDACEFTEVEQQQRKACRRAR
jgi:hypothetical protein